MKKIRRIIAVLLAVAIIFSGLAVPTKAGTVRAEDGNNSEYYYVTFYSSEGYIYGESERTSETWSIPKGDSIGGMLRTYGRSHYAFDGWAIEGTDEIIDTYSYIPEGDMKLVAKWSEAYDITFKSNYENSTEPDEVVQVRPGEHVNPKYYYRNGYNLLGYKIDNAGDLITIEDLQYYTFDSDAVLYAQWTNTYKVLYYSKEGYVYGKENFHESEVDINLGDPINIFSTVEGYDGHFLAGWKEDTNGDKIGDGDLMTYADLACYYPDHNVFLVAQWEEYEYPVKVTFISEEGYISGESDLKSKTINVAAGSWYSSSSWPSLYREGYIAYIKDVNDPNATEINYASSDIYSVKVNTDTTFQVIWKEDNTEFIKLSFYSEKGYMYGDKDSKESSATIKKGDALGSSCPNVSGIDHKVLIGWKIKDTGEIINIDDIYYYYPDRDLKLEAVYADSYDVTFYSKEGYFYGNKYNTTQKCSVVSGKTVGYFSNPEKRDGYSVVGWKIDENGDGIGEGELLAREDICNTPITEDVTYVAQWSEACKITYISQEGYIDGTRLDKERIRYNQKGSIIYENVTCYGRDGYIFVGWKDQKTGEIYEDLNFVIEEDMVFEAVWEEAYKVTLISESGYFSGIPQKKQIHYYIRKGSSINSNNMYEHPYDRSNYIFDCYRTEGGVRIDASSFKPNSDITLYAVWGEEVKAIFDANGGEFSSGNEESYVSVVKGKKSNISPAIMPRRDGYLFRGWQKVGTTEEPWYYSTEDTLNTDTTYKAQWVKSYKLKFVATGDGYFSTPDKIKEMTYEAAADEVFGNVIDAVNPGYVLKGWKEDSTSKIYKMNELRDYIAKSDSTFYSVWERAIVVSFDANGGQFSLPYGNDDVVTYECENGVSKILYPSLPTRDGYICVGWHLEGGEDWMSTRSVTGTYTADATYKAIWKKAVKVTYKLNGGYISNGPTEKLTGDVVVDKTIDSYLGDYYNILNDDTSLIFSGWKNEADGTFYPQYTLSNQKVGEEDMTFIAQFDPAVNITFDLNGGYYTSGPMQAKKTDPLVFKIAKGTSLDNKYYIYPINYDGEGKALDGWTKGDDTSKVYKLSEIKNMQIEEDTTFKAHWNDNPYIITFASDEGYLKYEDESAKEVKLYYNADDHISCPIDTKRIYYRSDYYIDHWKLDGDNTEYSDSDIYNLKITKDMTFKAVWKPGVKMVFDGNGAKLLLGPGYQGEVITRYYCKGDKVWLDSIPTYEGFTFQGWFVTDNTSANGTILSASSQYFANDTATFKAVWKNNATGEVIGGTSGNGQNTNSSPVVTPSGKTVLPQNNAGQKASGNNGSNSSNSSNSNASGNKAGNTKPKYSSEWIDGKWYNEDGTQTYGGTLSWKSNSTGWWVEDTDGWYPTSCWQKIDGIWYYFKPDGYMASGEYYGGYWFNSDGSWDSTYQLSWKSNSTGWWVEDISGWWPSSSWLKVDGYWYYFDGSGYMVTSQYIDGYWLGADGACQ